MYNTNSTEVNRNLKVTALTADTMYRLAAILKGDRFAPLQFEESEASTLEHLAYCANMGASDKESAWLRFAELILKDTTNKGISEEVKERIDCAVNSDRYDILIFDEDGDAISETVFEKEEIAIGIASQHITEASEANEAVKVIVVDTHTDECLYEAQTIGTAYRIFEDWQSENETEPIYSAEEAAQAYADWLSDSIEGKDAYDNMLDECYEIIRIGSLTYYPSEVLEKTDPIAYRCGLSDWADSEYSDCLYNLERLDYGETWSGWGLNIKLVHIAEERTKGGEWVTL